MNSQYLGILEKLRFKGGVSYIAWFLVNICSQVFYDKSLKTKLGSHKAVKSFYDSAHVHLQASFCHVSLGTKIKLERLGEVSLYVHGKQLLATDQGMF